MGEQLFLSNLYNREPKEHWTRDNSQPATITHVGDRPAVNHLSRVSAARKESARGLFCCLVVTVPGYQSLSTNCGILKSRIFWISLPNDRELDPMILLPTTNATRDEIELSERKRKADEMKFQPLPSKGIEGTSGELKEKQDDMSKRPHSILLDMNSLVSGWDFTTGSEGGVFGTSLLNDGNVLFPDFGPSEPNMVFHTFYSGLLDYFPNMFRLSSNVELDPTTSSLTMTRIMIQMESSERKRKADEMEFQSCPSKVHTVQFM